MSKFATQAGLSVKSISRGSLARTAVLAAVVASCHQSAFAAVWDGQVDGVTSNGLNWVADVVPVAGDVLTFTGSNPPGGAITYDLPNGQNPSNIIFDANAQAFTFANTGTLIQLTAAAGVTNSSPNVQTIQPTTLAFGLGNATFTHSLSGNTAALNFSALGFRPDASVAATVNVINLIGNVGGTVSGDVTDATTFGVAARRNVSKNGTGTWNLNGALTFNSSGAINTGGSLGVSQGTLNIGGTAANTFRGTTTIAAGNLVLMKNSALGSTTEGTTITGGNANATLSLDGSAGDLTIAEPIINFQSANSTGTGVVPITGGLKNVAGNNVYSGSIRTSTGGSFHNIVSDGGTLNITGLVDTTSITTFSRVVRLGGASNGTISGQMTNDAPDAASATTPNLGLSVSKIGTGTWRLANTGTLRTGQTTVSEGVLEVANLIDGGTGLIASTANASSVGTSTNAASNVVLQGGTLRYVGTGDTTDRLFTVTQRGGTLDASGTGALTFDNTGGIANNNGPAAINGTFLSAATLVAVNSAIDNLSVGMGLTGAGIAPGTTITDVNLATGIITISTPTTAASVPSNSLSFPGGDAIDRTLTLTGSTLFDNTLAPSLSDPTGTGTLALLKAGATTWTLEGGNTHEGGTTVNDGRLVTANTSALGVGPVAVNGDAILTIGDEMVDTVGGIGGLSFASGTTLETADTDSLIALASGTFTIGDITLDLNNQFDAVGNYVLIDGVDGANAIGITTFIDANTATFDFSFDVVGNDGVLSVTLVPEPTTLGLLGAAGLLMARRRK